MAHSAVYMRSRKDLASAAEVQQKRDRVLTVQQVATRLGVGKSTVYNLIDSGDLASFKVGVSQGKRVYESEVERFQAAREEAE